MRKASPSGTMKVESEERRERMRVMLSFTIQPEKGDALIKEGRIGETLESILEDLQPEVAYFTDVEGTRGGYLECVAKPARERMVTTLTLRRTLTTRPGLARVERHATTSRHGGRLRRAAASPMIGK